MREGWESMRLTNFVWFQRGFDLPRNNFVEGNVPVYGSTSILGYHNVSKVKAPGIITGRSGTLGKFQFANEDFWPHNTSLWVKDFKDNDEKFAYYLLQTLDFTLFNSGGAVPTLNRNLLTAYIVNIPPLETQRKIASILSGYDDLIENNLKRIKILEEMAQQTYEEWFVRMRFPGYETAVMNEETGLPEGWDRKYFKAVLNFRTGKLDSNALKLQGEFDFYTCAKEVFKTDTYCFEGEAVLLGGNNATGDFALFYANSKLNAYQRTYIVTPKTDELSNVYVFQVLRTYLPHFKAVSSGASTKFLTMRILDKTKIIVPKTNVLEKFNSFTKPSFDAILKLQSQNQRLCEARDVLLPRLMMGIVEV